MEMQRSGFVPDLIGKRPVRIREMLSGQSKELFVHFGINLLHAQEMNGGELLEG